MNSRLPIDEDDIALIFEDIYRGRSLLPPHDVTTRPTLVRWDPARPLSLENFVVFDQPDAEKHVKTCWREDGSQATTPKELWGEDVQHLVDRRASEARRCRDWVM